MDAPWFSIVRDLGEIELVRKVRRKSEESPSFWMTRRRHSPCQTKSDWLSDRALVAFDWPRDLLRPKLLIGERDRALGAYDWSRDLLRPKLLIGQRDRALGAYDWSRDLLRPKLFGGCVLRLAVARSDLSRRSLCLHLARSDNANAGRQENDYAIGVFLW